jgi:ABC-type Fe3+/spermidine/putrescine transport system ATPase subunit
MAQPPNTLVELDRFTLTAGGRVLLKDASAGFEPGRVTLLVGASGTGKSLMLRTIAGLLDASHREVKAAGSVKIGGREVLGQSGPRSVGVVFQQFSSLRCLMS